MQTQFLERSYIFEKGCSSLYRGGILYLTEIYDTYVIQFTL